MTDPDIEKAEKNLIVNILTALSDKRIVGALVGLILATCSYAVYWMQTHTATTNNVAAGIGDPCCAVQAAAQGKGSVATNSLAKVFFMGCALSACQPTPAPVPPVPSAMGGSSSTGGASSVGGNRATGGNLATGGASPVAVQFPVCNPPTFAAPSPKKIEQYRRTLTPRRRPVGGGPAMFLDFTTGPVVSVFWASNDPWCGNQGNVGACEAFTQLDIATSKPRTLSFASQSQFNSAALSAYHWITANDSYPGTYPPNDTGSDSATGCKWLVENGYAKSCAVLSGATAVKFALQSGPVITGMNWLDGMFAPDRCGNLALTGNVQGGHAESIVGYDATADAYYLQNHWDNDWGICLGAHCGYHVLTGAQLFSTTLDADFVQPVQ